jgi:hypothetical protein
MSPDEALIYESRVRSRQVVVAVVAGLCLIIASIIQLSSTCWWPTSDSRWT